MQRYGDVTRFRGLVAHSRFGTRFAYLSAGGVSRHRAVRCTNGVTMAGRNPQPTVLSGSTVAALAGSVDFLLLTCAGFALYIGYVGWDERSLSNYAFAILSVSALMVAILNRGEWYDPYQLRQFDRQLRQVIRIAASVACFFIVIAFAFKVVEAFSRVWAFSWLGLCIVLLAGTRVFWSRYIAAAQRRGAFCQRVAIVGATVQAERCLTVFNEMRHSPYTVVGIYDDRSTRLHDAFDSDPATRRLSDLKAAIRRGEVDDVLLALPCSADERVHQLLADLRTLPVAVHLVPDLAGFLHAGVRVSYVLGVPTLDLMLRPIEERDLLLKAVCDRLLALGAIVVLSPLLIAIAIAVKLDSPGPVLFRQKRYGFNNRTFEVKKFRSMRVDADKAPGTAQATKNDPRVTRLGRILRKTSLDELPQLFNVLDGSMSLVGPRPHAADHHVHYERRIVDYSIRHKVKPGITGWAQVNGYRGETETLEKMAARVAHDAYYIENWSLWLDIKILVRTAVVVFFQKAY